MDIYINNVHEWIQNHEYLHHNIVSDNEATTTKYPPTNHANIQKTNFRRTTGRALEVDNFIEQILVIETPIIYIKKKKKKTNKHNYACMVQDDTSGHALQSVNGLLIYDLLEINLLVYSLMKYD